MVWYVKKLDIPSSIKKDQDFVGEKTRRALNKSEINPPIPPASPLFPPEVPPPPPS
jgi:hypothetical protein